MSGTSIGRAVVAAMSSCIRPACAEGIAVSVIPDGSVVENGIVSVIVIDSRLLFWRNPFNRKNATAKATTKSEIRIGKILFLNLGDCLDVMVFCSSKTKFIGSLISSIVSASLTDIYGSCCLSMSIGSGTFCSRLSFFSSSANSAIVWYRSFGSFAKAFSHTAETRAGKLLM